MQHELQGMCNAGNYVFGSKASSSSSSGSSSITCMPSPWSAGRCVTEAMRSSMPRTTAFWPGDGINRLQIMKKCRDGSKSPGHM